MDVLVFEISGLGVGVLAYWESYALMLVFGLFGVVSLRLALNPRGVRVYRGPVRAVGRVSVEIRPARHRNAHR